MNKKKWLKGAALAGAVIAALCLAGCGGKETASSAAAGGEQVITDITGKEVMVPAHVNHAAIVPIPWASVSYALDGSSERIGAVHPSAMTAYKGHFMEKMDPHFGSINTKIIAQNFSINIESALNEGIDAAVLWSYQDKDAAKLNEAGIPAVMINNDSMDNLKKSFLIVGKLFGKEDRARQLNAYYDNAYQDIQSHKEEIDRSQKPVILFLRTKDLRLQGNDNFMHQIELDCGGDNPFAQQKLSSGSNEQISMEEVYKINPDIILLSNFDTFVPDDLYENRIAGQDWSSVKAVQDHRVYKVPMGIYRWDAPGVETPLMMKWMARVFHPEIFQSTDIRQDMKSFYKNFMNYDLTDEEIDSILAVRENHNSRSL